MAAITERPLLDFMRLSINGIAWASPLSSVHIDRGGKRDGATQTVSVGTLTCTFVNAGDPMDPGEGFGTGPFGTGPFGGGDPAVIAPNDPVFLTAEVGPIFIRQFTGYVNDVATEYRLNKSTGVTTTFTTVTAVDAVSPLVNTTRYGVLVEGGAQFETWAQRMNRLALSAPAGVTVQPADETQEIKVYAL